MTYVPVIYDWRDTVVPVKQVFIAGGQSLDGGMTLGGASVENPEPGGRAELRLEFDPFATAATNLDASYLASRMLNSAVFRIRLWQPTVQLLSDTILGGSTDLGANWSNNLGWDSDIPWAFEPSSAITLGGAKGATQFRYDTADFGRVLKVGHVIGLRKDGYDFAHMVVDISYPSINRALLTVEPPLRRTIIAADRILFRPAILATCVNAREVVGNFIYGTSLSFGPARFVEALV